MAHRFRAYLAAMPASSPAAVTLFLAATMGPIVAFAAAARLLAN